MRADLNSSLRKRSIHNLLAMFKKLRSFAYEPCDPLDFKRKYYDFEPDKICQSLLLYAGHSLTHLKIHARCRCVIIKSRLLCGTTLTRGKL